MIILILFRTGLSEFNCLKGVHLVTEACKYAEKTLLVSTYKEILFNFIYVCNGEMSQLKVPAIWVITT